MVGLAQVVDTGVNDDGSADDRVRPDKRKLRIADLDFGDTRGVGLEVAQVADVPDFSSSVTVGGTGRVEVRTGGGAAVGVVTELVHVEASLSVGIHVLDFTRDGDGTAGGFLGEGDDTLDGGVSLEDSNGLLQQVWHESRCGVRKSGIARSRSHGIMTRKRTIRDKITLCCTVMV